MRMEQSTLSNESIDKEKTRKQFTYRDNSLPDQPIIFEVFATGVIQADSQFSRAKGFDPARELNISCTVEDLAEIEKKEFEEFVRTHLDAVGSSLAEYATVSEEGVYRNYMESLGLVPEDLAGKRVLDIGSNNSFFASYCLKHGISDNIYSVDGGAESYGDRKLKKAIWSEQLQSAIEGKTKTALMQDLPYEDGTMHLIVINAALPGRDQEFRGELTLNQDVDQSYDEIVRVLAPGGEARIAPLSNDEGDEYFGEWYEVTKKKLEALSHVEGITVVFEAIPECDGWQRIIIRKAPKLEKK